MRRPARNPRRAYDEDGNEIRPATVGESLAAGASHILAQCQKCLHEAVLPIEQFPADVYVPDVSLRMVCSACGSKRVRTTLRWKPR